MCAVALAIAPLWAKTRKGDHFYKLGMQAESQKKYDEAVEDYDQAVASDAKEASYLIAPNARTRLPRNITLNRARN